MMDWADTNEFSWDQYFLYVSLSRATYDIKDGKISPWIILNSPTGKDLLKKMNDEQLTLISAVIDPQFWVSKFRKLPKDVAMVKQVIQESNL
jgi:uroporphyrinogen-III decarboxylase